MPVDNLGQTFRFIVEQAGGGGGGGGADGGTSGGGSGGAAAKATRQANEMRRMMDKMTRAVDQTEKTTANAFTQGFKKLGFQLTFANMLKQSQVFTGTLNAIFQVVGALIDITLAPFMPLIVKFLQKAIPRLLDFAERMAQWVRGELAQLDEMGLAGYLIKKLEEDLPKAFDKFGPIVASSMNTITQIVVKAIPKTTAIAIKAMGEITSVVIGSAIAEVGKLMSLAVGNVIKIVSDMVAGSVDKLGEITGLDLSGWADDLRESGIKARDKMETLGADVFEPMGAWVEEGIRNLFTWTANLIESDEVQSMFDALAESLGSLVESGILGGAESLKSIIESLATVIKDNVEIMQPEPGLEPPEPLTVTTDPTVRYPQEAARDEYTGETHWKATTDQMWQDAVRQREIDATLAEEASSASLDRIESQLGATDAAWNILKDNVEPYAQPVPDWSAPSPGFNPIAQADADMQAKASKTAAWMAELADIQEGYTGTQTLPMHTGMGGQWEGRKDIEFYEVGGVFPHPREHLFPPDWAKPELMPGHKDFGKDPMRSGGSHPDASPRGFQEWNPLTGWDLIPGNWQKGSGGIWDRLTGNKDRWQGEISESANGNPSVPMTSSDMNILEAFGQGGFGQELGYNPQNLAGQYETFEVDVNLQMNNKPVDVEKVSDDKTSNNKKQKLNADLGHIKWEEDSGWGWGT